MCQAPIGRRLPKLASHDEKAVPAPPPSSSSAPRNDDPNSSGPLRVLICSENVPPQVNGIARRIGCYADGLKNLGCDVDVLHPDSGSSRVLSHTNPWNFTARMMIVRPYQIYKLLTGTPYDVVHVVMPANLSAMWILAAFKILRCIKRESKPALVVSWHCNLVDYLSHFAIGPARYLAYFFFYLLFGMLPLISDRVLTPTKKSEPRLVKLWKRSSSTRSGVCFTGVNKTEFSPESLDTDWGRNWMASKEKYLAREGKEHLLVCVGRLSPEKGVDELIKVLPSLPNCALWLAGDGPFRPELERLAQQLSVPVKFLGYQSGTALHSVYAVADLFVCPSLTETFGQTVNEALASRVRVALPNVPVFAEAYGSAVPADAFWTPLSQSDMASSISKQLERHSRKDRVGLPDLDKLKSWQDACQILLEDYHKAFEDRQHTFTFFAWVYFPVWCAMTITTIISFFVFSQVRCLCGGSVRVFFRSAAEDLLIKVVPAVLPPSQSNSLRPGRTLR